ncbi:MAG: S24 family peptidase [Pyrinomonadaceae bacterium]|nr:S24 family peptidase [Pyrinomonadaceae bacterium]
MYLTEFIPLEPTSDNYLLLTTVSIPAGEPAHLCTDLEKFNLQEHITRGREGIYTTRVVGDSMETEIKDGDLLIVNRNLIPQTGDIVIAYLNGAYTVKLYEKKNNVLYLVPKNRNYESQIITQEDDFETYGVVTFILHQVKNF